jgi:hypothetical protein
VAVHNGKHETVIHLSKTQLSKLQSYAHGDHLSMET